jgi:hypothetical protein
VGCTTRRCSVVAGHAALWYCSWGYTARLGGPPIARRCTPSHCGVCDEGRHGSSCTRVGESSPLAVNNGQVGDDGAQRLLRLV